MALNEADKADIARIEKYLGRIKTLRSRFFQVAPDGHLTSGGFWLSRPGRLRFEYDPPTPHLVLADGFWIIFIDTELGGPQRWPISDTPLGVLVNPEVRLASGADIETIGRGPGRLSVTLRDRKRPEDGTMTLMFSDRPLILRQWRVEDGQGQRTTVTLDKIEIGVELSAELFEVPDKYNQVGRGEN